MPQGSLAEGDVRVTTRLVRLLGAGCVVVG
jgi:hypothetical protein